MPGIQSVLNKCSPWATPAAPHPGDKLWGTAGHSQPGSPLIPSFPRPSLSPSHTLSPSVMPGLPTNLSATKDLRSALSLQLPDLRGGRSVGLLAAITFGMRLVEQGPHGHHSERESWGDLLQAKQGCTTTPCEPTTSKDERRCSVGLRDPTDRMFTSNIASQHHVLGLVVTKEEPSLTQRKGLLDPRMGEFGPPRWSRGLTLSPLPALGPSRSLTAPLEQTHQPPSAGDPASWRGRAPGRRAGADTGAPRPGSRGQCCSGELVKWVWAHQSAATRGSDSGWPVPWAHSLPGQGLKSSS